MLPVSERPSRKLEENHDGPLKKTSMRSMLRVRRIIDGLSASKPPDLLPRSGAGAPRNEEQAEILAVDHSVSVEIRGACVRTDAPGHKEQAEILPVDGAVPVQISLAIDGIAVDLKEIMEAVLSRKRFIVIARRILRVDLITREARAKRSIRHTRFDDEIPLTFGQDERPVVRSAGVNMVFIDGSNRSFAIAGHQKQPCRKFRGERRRPNAIGGRRKPIPVDVSRHGRGGLAVDFIAAVEDR